MSNFSIYLSLFAFILAGALASDPSRVTQYAYGRNPYSTPCGSCEKAPLANIATLHECAYFMRPDSIEGPCCKVTFVNPYDSTETKEVYAYWDASCTRLLHRRTK